MILLFFCLLVALPFWGESCLGKKLNLRIILPVYSLTETSFQLEINDLIVLNPISVALLGGIRLGERFYLQSIEANSLEITGLEYKEDADPFWNQMMPLHFRLFLTTFYDVYDSLYWEGHDGELPYSPLSKFLLESKEFNNSFSTRDYMQIQATNKRVLYERIIFGSFLASSISGTLFCFTLMKYKKMQARGKNPRLAHEF